MLVFESLKKHHLSELRSWISDDEEINHWVDFYTKPEHWLRLTQNENRYGWAVKKEGEIVAIYDMEVEEGVGHIAFALKSTVRGIRLSKEVLFEAEKLPEVKNVKKLVGSTDVSNIGSQRLLESVGFVKVGENKRYNLINYQKSLTKLL
jgi:RimJ/RimL family protein N-acetyltransferase